MTRLIKPSHGEWGESLLLMASGVRSMSYTLVKKIAQGGMAEIFLARKFDAKGNLKLWCVKRILSMYAEDEEFTRMFRDEYRITKRFIHPSLIAIKELVHIGGMPSIVMEFVPGTDVRDILVACEKSDKRLSIPMVCYLVKEASRGLHHAHVLKDEEGKPLKIVHRDVSPQNILVSFDGRVKVIDFGIAANEAKLNHTRAGIIKGKFSYMSPEQVMMKPVDARTDVFAIGVVLWEMLAMRKLFMGRNEVETIELVKNARFSRDLRGLNKKVDDELYRITMKALSKDLSERYSSSKKLAQDLDAYLKKVHPNFERKDLAQFITTILRRKYRKTRELIKTACNTSAPIDDEVTGAQRSSKLASLAEISERKELGLRKQKQRVLKDSNLDTMVSFEELESTDEEEFGDFSSTATGYYSMGEVVSDEALAAPVSEEGDENSVFRVAEHVYMGENEKVGPTSYHSVYHKDQLSKGIESKSTTLGLSKNAVKGVFIGLAAIIVAVILVTMDWKVMEAPDKGAGGGLKDALIFSSYPKNVMIKVNGASVSDEYITTPYRFDISELNLGKNVFVFSRDGFVTREYVYTKDEDSSSKEMSITLKASSPMSKVKVRIDSQSSFAGRLSFRLADNLSEGSLARGDPEIVNFLLPNRVYIFFFRRKSTSFKCSLRTLRSDSIVEYVVDPGASICYRS